MYFKKDRTNLDSHPYTEEKQFVVLLSPYINLTAVEGKSHLRLKSGLTLVELQVSSNCSPFFRITVSFWDSVITGGISGTGSRCAKRTLS